MEGVSDGFRLERQNWYWEMARTGALPSSQLSLCPNYAESVFR